MDFPCESVNRSIVKGHSDKAVRQLRERWFADIDWDRRQPAPTYPLIKWTGEKR